MDTRFVTVATFNFSHDAHMAKNKLEAEGITCIIADEFTIAMVWLYSNALGGIKVKVPEEQYEEARNILDEDYSDDLNDIEDHVWDEEFEDIPDPDGEVECPYCHSTDNELIESEQPATLLSRLTFGMVHPQARYRYKCHICLSEWTDEET